VNTLHKGDNVIIIIIIIIITIITISRRVKITMKTRQAAMLVSPRRRPFKSSCF
jgi:hypothetical protein